jgi:hypothetical protein
MGERGQFKVLKAPASLRPLSHPQPENLMPEDCRRPALPVAEIWRASRNVAPFGRLAQTFVIKFL